MREICLMNINLEHHPMHEYRIIGASSPGPLHVINATPCQDAFSYKVLPSGVGLIAVADGLGSAFLSDLGATDATITAVLSARQNISSIACDEPDLKQIAKDAVSGARKALEEKAQEYQCELKDLACTLIVVAMHNDNVAVAHIGDGAVVAETRDGLQLISSPEDSEYANEVFPLTGKEWWKHLRVTQVVSCISGIMAFTDGLQRAALKKTPDGFLPFDAFCAPLFSYVKEVKNVKEARNDMKNLLSSKKVCDNSEDDKTLVVATFHVTKSKGTALRNE